ncbi:gluconolactonase [Serratia sp. DD3]|nr:gluconolactonase [Serratia sp. DD3]
MIKNVFLGLLFCLSMPLAAQSPQKPDTELLSPESVSYSPSQDVYFVSNMNGPNGDLSNDGFVSKMAPDGSILELKWIEGGKNGVVLHAPAGMAVGNNILWMTDYNTVKGFDLTTRELVGEYVIHQASMLNDIAIDSQGNLYVTDSGILFNQDKETKDKNKFIPTGTDAIYKIDGQGKIIRLASGVHLDNPNGIAISPDDHVYFVTKGGGVFVMQNDGTVQEYIKLPHGRLDGIAFSKTGTLFVTSWAGEGVYRIKDGKVSLYAENLSSPASLGYDSKRNTLAIPLLLGNQVSLISAG